MKLNKIISYGLLCSLFLTTPMSVTQAEEVLSTKEAATYLSENMERDIIEPKQIDNIDELYNAPEKLNDFATLIPADPYESNDTIDTAYPYSRIPTLTTSITNIYTDLYTLGMKSASLHSPTDEDWYSINLTRGEEYFVDLRNIGMRNWYIELYYIYATEEGYDGYYYSTDDARYLNKPERYFYFIAQDSGTFYIRVATDNDWVDQMNYFFHVGPSVQTYSMNVPTGNTAQFISNNYSTPYYIDLTNAVPKDSIFLNASLTNNFIGTYCDRADKRFIGGGRTYTNSSSTGSETINMPTNPYALVNQSWGISGRCTHGNHYTKWNPYLKGTFMCIMNAYPGNEL